MEEEKIEFEVEITYHYGTHLKFIATRCVYFADIDAYQYTLSNNKTKIVFLSDEIMSIDYDEKWIESIEKNEE